MEMTTLFDTGDLILLSNANSYSDMLEKAVRIPIRLDGKIIGKIVQVKPTEELSPYSVIFVDVEDDYKLKLMQSKHLGFSIGGHTVHGSRLVNHHEKGIGIKEETTCGKACKDEDFIPPKHKRTEHEEMIHTLNEVGEISTEISEIIQNHEWDLVYEGLKAKVQMMEHIMKTHETKGKVEVKPVGNASGRIRIEKSLEDVKDPNIAKLLHGIFNDFVYTSNNKPRKILIPKKYKEKYVDEITSTMEKNVNLVDTFMFKGIEIEFTSKVKEIKCLYDGHMVK